MIQLLDLALLTIAIALAVSATVIFYRSLSERSAVTGRFRRMVERQPWSRPSRLLAELIGSVIASSVLVFVWVAVVEVALYFILPVERMAEIFLLPYAIVAASRLLAYLHPTAAHELAKTLPLALIVLLLVGQPQSIATLEAKAVALDEQLTDDFLLLLAVIVLEVLLRLASVLRRYQHEARIAPRPTPTSTPVSRC